MKKLILMLLGYDTDAIKELKAKINKLTSENNYVDEFMEEALTRLKGVNKAEARSIIYETRKEAQKKWAKENKDERVIARFHGGCQGCITPLEDGIGKCLGCQYFNGDWSKPDLKRERVAAA